MKLFFVYLKESIPDLNTDLFINAEDDISAAKMWQKYWSDNGCDITNAVVDVKDITQINKSEASVIYWQNISGTSIKLNDLEEEPFLWSSLP